MLGAAAAEQPAAVPHACAWMATRAATAPTAHAPPAGLELLLLGQEEMYIELALSASRIGALLELQAATALFDDIASRPGQGRISEVRCAGGCTHSIACRVACGHVLSPAL
jgi:hypothetical protein